MSDFPFNTGDKAFIRTDDQPLSQREHLSPESHRFGVELFAPQPPPRPSGNPGAGVSPAPARSDHQHGATLTPWINDAARFPIVTNESSRGASSVISQYRVVDKECQWWGHYALGTGVSWAGGNISMWLPILAEGTLYSVNGGVSMPVPGFRAYNGQFWPGYGELLNGNAITLYTYSTPSVPAGVWLVGAPGTPFTWAVGQVLSWHIKYVTAL